MIGALLELPRARFAALGTTASVTLTDPCRLEHAEAVLRAQLDQLDRACSRFRPDSETSRLARRAGRRTLISPLLVALLGAALRAAEFTDGLVDPTLGRAMIDAGYDRDLADVRGLGEVWGPDARPVPSAGVAVVHLDVAAGAVQLPAGVLLDLGATAKAFAADRAADALSADLGCGVLVEIGGDVAARGPAPTGGWLLAAGLHHLPPEESDDREDGDDDGGDAGEQVIGIQDGAVATSSTTVRTWRRGGRSMHHILDPRTGLVAAPVWQAVTVAAATCMDANAASTAAVVLGEAAPGWLQARNLPSLLVRGGRRPVAVAGWPDPPTRCRGAGEGSP